MLNDRPRIAGTRRLLKDEGYRGPLRSRRYFEGWYLKQVTTDGRTVAVIVGISLGTDPHAFVQLLDGSNGRTLYVRYPANAFSARRDRFEVSLGPNRFSPRGLSLDLREGDTSVSGELSYTGRVRYPATVVSPGIMGPYTYAPFMECYHGAVSLDHAVSGRMVWDGETIDFDGGRGYIEKDWGRSMPSDWLWLQGNHFADEGDSLMVSIARIPWLGFSFTGHLGFLRADGRIHRFATYTGSRIRDTRAVEDGWVFTLTGKPLDLQLDIRREGGEGGLKAPVSGNMSRTIKESGRATVSARLLDRQGATIWEGRTGSAGLEETGEVAGLLGAE